MTSGWILDANAPAVLELVARFAQSELTDAEWTTLLLLRDSSAREGKWLEYELGEATLRLAYDEPGTSVVQVEWSGPDVLRCKVEVLMDIAAERSIETLRELP